MGKIRLKAVAPPDSDDDSPINEGDHETVQKRLRLMRDLEDEDKPRMEFVGGIVVSSESQANELSSKSASLSAAEKKGLKEVEELERELDLKNTFSKETNRRDEDAEMNKYIDEQIRQRRLAAEKERESRYERDRQQTRTSELGDLFTLPMGTAADAKVDDILLHQLVKNHPVMTDEKSEAMLSSQMLTGIPEVDLGMKERIKTIEETEEAKLRLAANTKSRANKKPSSIVPVNYSTNYQQHRSSRDKSNGTNKYQINDRHSSSVNNDAKTVCEPVVLVDEEPREVEVQVAQTNRDGYRPPMKGRASDDYHLQKFKKNSRR